ncbi:MAG: hypothetical protein HDQ98_12960 [Lachnospiraceae bacterium]|nr:hypothetical protein [Lachnospiraceae bacterium]
MLFVIVNWIYLAVTSFLLGTAFAKFVRRVLGWEMKSATETMFYGLIWATVYAQVFSLFGGVGALANGILLAACIVIALVWKKTIKSALVQSIKTSGRAHSAVVLILVLIWAYCASRGYMHYDSDLYHAQSIRWIEEYGVAPGLGNIHVRFAYNSSFFALSALYSMKFLGGQSLHAVNGFLALLLSVEVLKAFRVKRFCLSDFARLGAFYYLTVLYRDIVAPASDYAVMCVVFFIIIRWLVHLEQKEHSVAPYALLCVAGVYAVTLKLTAGCILLLVLKPAISLIKEKKGKEIAVYIAMGLLVLAPWVIRTALISGYLLYPFPALDVLTVDWKIPVEAAARDAAEIKTWGRGLNDAALVNMPVTEWFPNWFSTMLPMLGKLFLLADFVCVAVFFGILVSTIIRHGKNKGEAREWDGLLVLACMLLSFEFWLFSAPLLRYGYAYVLLVIVLTAGILYRKVKIPAAAERLFAVLVFAFLAVKAVTFARYAWSVSDEPYYIAQQEYGTYELDSFEVNDVRFYYPVSGDRVGYEAFPAIPLKKEILFRGESLEDGFCGR